jgi:uncharacterized protein (TIGR00730 family)
MALRRICVFCGSAAGSAVLYRDAGRRLGAALARRGSTLVYGGASVGVMGAVADGVLAAGGRAIGVMPRALFPFEVAHGGLTELREVGSMHERKALMADLADAFLALPGGIGTLDEWFEAWTWAQLGIHDKPLGLLNVGGYFDPLLAFLDRMVAERFLKPRHRALPLVDTDVEPLLDRLAAAAETPAPTIEPQLDPAER